MSATKKRRAQARILEAKNAIAIGHFDACFLENESSNAADAMRHYSSRLTSYIVEDTDESLPEISFAGTFDPPTTPENIPDDFSAYAEGEPVGSATKFVFDMGASGSVSTLWKQHHRKEYQRRTLMKTKQKQKLGQSRHCGISTLPPTPRISGIALQTWFFSIPTTCHIMILWLVF